MNFHTSGPLKICNLDANAPHERKRSRTSDQAVLSSGLVEIDNALEGGFQSGWLVEVFGESSTGKTQLSFHVAASALMEGRDVYWIDTDGTFRPDRIVEICGGEGSIIERTRHCCVSSLGELLEKLRVLRRVMTRYTSSENEPLLVIDSIASLARLMGSATTARQNLLHEVAIIVKSMPAVTVCTNHVLREEDDPVQTRPMLGAAWTSDVTCSIHLVRPTRETQSGQYRYMRVVTSPHAHTAVVPFEITKSGIRAV